MFITDLHSWAKISKSLLHGVECSLSRFRLLRLSTFLFLAQLFHSTALFPFWSSSMKYLLYFLLLLQLIRQHSTDNKQRRQTGLYIRWSMHTYVWVVVEAPAWWWLSAETRFHSLSYNFGERRYLTEHLCISFWCTSLVSKPKNWKRKGPKIDMKIIQCVVTLLCTVIRTSTKTGRH